MSKSVNEVTLIGNVGRDPEYAKNSDKIVRLLLATSSGGYTARDGRNVEEVTEWHDVALFGKEGEFAMNYVKKGNTVYVNGKLRSNTKEENGKKVKYWSIEASKIINLSQKTDANTNSQPTPPPPPQPVFNSATGQWELPRF